MILPLRPVGRYCMRSGCVFSPALISFPAGSYKEVPPAPPSSASLNIGVAFKHYNGTEFFFGGGEEVDAPQIVDGAERRLTHESLNRHNLNESKSKDDFGEAEGKDGSPVLESDANYGGAMDESGNMNMHGAGISGVYDEDSSEIVDAGFAAPERPEDIACPKIFGKASLPEVAVGAIYNSSARDAKSQDVCSLGQ